MYRSFIFNFLAAFFFLIILASPGFAENAITDADAKLDKSVFEARGSNETLLHISKTGQYSIQATSKQGSRITIVDRMAGPYISNGSPGEKDGRIDLLLDKRTYKIRIDSHSNGSGQLKLNARPFKFVNPVPDITQLPYLRNHQLIRDTLGDFQQHAFWIHIKERQVLNLEMLGRNLKDARLWRDGTWLEEIRPSIYKHEPIPGHPMTYIEFHHDINPGLYLISCYGGQALPWTKDSSKHPFYLRMGVPYLGSDGQRLMEISPFGRDSFWVDGSTNFFQLVREEKKPTRLSIRKWQKTSSRYYSNGIRSEITKKSRDPWCVIRNSYSGKKQWVTVSGTPGDKVELDFFVKRRIVRLDRKHHDFWISSIHSAEGRDALDVTGFLTHWNKDIPVKADVITVGDKPVTRKVNLMGTMTVFVHFQGSGTCIIHEFKKSGAQATYQLKPFMNVTPGNYKAPEFQEPGTDWAVTAGYYVLTIRPKLKGIIHFTLQSKSGWFDRTSRPAGSSTPTALIKNSQHPRHTLQWPNVRLKSSHHYYTLILNDRPEVDTGIIVRPLPLQLQAPLPVSLEPKESIEMNVEFKTKSNLLITGGKFQVKIDDNTWNGSSPIAAGPHVVKLINNDSRLRLFNVKAEDAKPYTPPPHPVLKKIEDIFPILSETRPLFRDFDRTEKHQFLLQVDSPGLYRLETTGRMATAITVRSKTITSLFSGRQNGIGRNALVQEYLNPGDYLVGVQTLGRSKGRAGIFLHRTELVERQGLVIDSVKRISLPADAAVRYQVDITEPGEYKLETYGLGKDLSHRFDDAEGWPLEIPGKEGIVHFYLPKDTYYYYSLPEPVASRRLTFLKQVKPKNKISGKGPHPMKLNEKLENTWMEDESRTPDIYRVKISAPIKAFLTVTGKLEAEIIAHTGPVEKGKIMGSTIKGQWSGSLPAGTFDVAVKSKAKNNRVSYDVSLRTNDLIPGITQNTSSYPKTFTVSLNESALVDIESFGAVDVRATLTNLYSLASDEDHIAISADDMEHDWNFRISRSLKAGQYSLCVSRADTGFSSGRVEVSMNTRKEIEKESQTIPFSINQDLSEGVLKIPFRTGAEESLMQITAQNTHSSIKLALQRDGRLLAECSNQMYIPLRPDTAYTLLAWSDGESKSKTVVKGTAMRTKNILLTGSRQSLGLDDKTALILTTASPTAPKARPDNTAGLNNASSSSAVGTSGLSFHLNPTGGRGPVFYSPMMERPCLPVDNRVEGMDAGRGWLVTAGRSRNVRLEPLNIRVGTTEISLNDVPFTYAINQTDDAPMLLEIKSVSALTGTSVFPTSNRPENLYQRAGMLAIPSRTFSGIPGKGNYYAHTWLTSATPPVYSEKHRFDTGERITLNLHSFPKQKQLDFTGKSTIEIAVEPGKSVCLQLKDESRLLDLTLAQGLVAFTWHNGRPLSIAAALDKNTEARMMVRGEMLYVVNTIDSPARFRAEKRGIPQQELTDFHPQKGFEKIFPTPGTLQIKLPPLPAGTRLFIAGTDFNGRLWGTDGKLYYGRQSTLQRNLQIEIYENTAPLTLGRRRQVNLSGVIEIHYKPGLVKLWTGSSTDEGGTFIGDAIAATKTQFENGMGTLSHQLQAWEFSLDKDCYVNIESMVPTAMTLLSGGDVLFVGASAFSGSSRGRLNHFLPAGTYRLLTRQFPGPESPGTLTMKTISPIPLEEGADMERLLIRPGEIQVFRFTVQAKGIVGVGLETENDLLEAELFDEKSHRIASGPLALKKLDPGSYLLVVRARGIPVQYRPIILGAKGSREGVPYDVVQKYKKEANQ